MGEFLIYKSSAGSGKTTALIQIFLKLSLRSDNPSQFKKLLAITFTNKAAGEMKDRFISELDKISNTTLDYSEGNFMIDWLLKELAIDIETLRNRARSTFQRALQDYDDIAISTIDRFNHRLIRSFSRELGIPSDFEVSMQINELYRDAVLRVIEQYGENELVSKELLKYIKLKSDNEENINIINALLDLKSLVISDEAELAIKKLDEYDFDETGKKYRASLNQNTQTIRKFGNEFLDYCESNGLDSSNFYRTNSGVFGYFVKCRDFPNKTMEANSYVQSTLEGQWTSKSATKDIKEAVAPHEAYFQELLNKTYNYIESHISQFNLQKELSSKLNLIAVLGEVSESILAICDEQNILPIHSFNLIISQALRNEPVAYLYEQIGSRYKHILIDEYQDTSQLQWFNLLPLIDESLATGNDNLVVGDAKQSIYRFRGGKAEQLISLPKLIDAPPELKATEQTLVRTHRTEQLSSNYRSQKRIVDFNNQFFSSLAKLKPFQNELYNEAYFEENVTQEIAKTGLNGLIKVKAWKKTKDLEQDTEYIFEQIQACKALGYRYGDMAILVRNNKHAGPIIDKLRAANISVSTAESLQLDKDPEIRFVESMLRLLHDKGNNIAKVRAIRNFGFMKDIPFEIMPYRKGTSIDFNSFLKAQGLSPISAVKGAPSLFEAAQQIAALYLPNSQNPYLTGFFDTILNHFGYNGTIQDFLVWWDSLDNKPSLTTESSPDAVQVMTIHKSKGLQFKLVFMPKANWNVHSKFSNYRWFDLSHLPEALLPYAPLPVSKKLAEMGLEKEWAKEEDDVHFDHFNTLYVGFTRAEHGLFVSYHQEKNSTSDWLDMTFDQMKSTHFSKDDTFQFIEGLDEPENSELIVGQLNSQTADQDDPEKFNKLKRPQEPQAIWSNRIKPVTSDPSDDQTLGVLLHQLAATTRSLTEAQIVLKRMKSRFTIDSQTHELLSQLVNALFTDKRFVALIKKGNVFAERGILMKGKTKRPDMVVETDDECIILDFKTGEESKTHQQQVAEYMAGLSNLNSNKVTGFLLYVDKIVKWTEVKTETAATQASLFD